MELIRHEMAHLAAFKELAEEEGISEEVCLAFGETFDAAMTQEALDRLYEAYEKMRHDRGLDDPIVQACRFIDDPEKAEEFTQMKGALAAIVHPTGQMWVLWITFSFVVLLTTFQPDGRTSLSMHCFVSWWILGC